MSDIQILVSLQKEKTNHSFHNLWERDLFITKPQYWRCSSTTLTNNSIRGSLVGGEGRDSHNVPTMWPGL
jgi:hypothetical protein